MKNDHPSTRQTQLPDTLPAGLSPERISAYVHGLLSDEENKKIEHVLQTSDAALVEAQEAWRHAAAHARQDSEPVPVALQTRVAALWEGSAKKTGITASFSRFVIQIAHTGLALIDRELVAPMRGVQEVFTPLPAYRSDDTPSVLNLKLDAGGAEIRATAIQEGQAVACTITLLNNSQEPLAGQRIFLRQQGRILFSAKTDGSGMLRLPRLESGKYEVACSGIHTTFQLELRS